MARLRAPQLLLPWESSAEDDARYRSILGRMLGAFVVVAALIPWLPVPEVQRQQEEARTPQLAQVLLEKKILPPPRPAERKPPPQKKRQPEPVRPAKARPVDPKDQARDLAQSSGLLSFKDDLAALRDNVDLSNLNNTRISRGQASAETTQRSVLTRPVNTSSGGIRTAAISRDTGGPALSGREATRVHSPITSNSNRNARNKDNSATSTGGRSDESIRRTMDRNKGGIFAIYNRALRENPLLQGKLVIEMVIDASGEITELSLLSSELTDQALSKKLLARIRTIQFGGENVIATRVNYSFDFMPY